MDETTVVDSGERSSGGVDAVNLLNFARLATWIDGEGSIFINDPNGTPNVGIAVYNKSPLVMEWLLTMFGGLIRPHMDILKWLSPAGGRKSILEGIHPFLIIKQRHAEVALTMLKCIHSDRHPSQKEVLLRFKLAEVLYELNAATNAGARKQREGRTTTQEDSINS